MPNKEGSSSKSDYTNGQQKLYNLGKRQTDIKYSTSVDYWHLWHLTAMFFLKKYLTQIPLELTSLRDYKMKESHFMEQWSSPDRSTFVYDILILLFNKDKWYIRSCWIKIMYKILYYVISYHIVLYCIVLMCIFP